MEKKLKKYEELSLRRSKNSYTMLGKLGPISITEMTSIVTPYLGALSDSMPLDRSPLIPSPYSLAELL